MEQYQEVFKVGDKLKMISGGPTKLELKEGVKVKRLHVNTSKKTIQVCHTVVAKANLDTLVRLGVLEKIDDPIDWVLPCQFVPKADGEAKLICDLSYLNT